VTTTRPHTNRDDVSELERLWEEYEIRHDIEVADANIAALGDDIAELTGQNIDLEVWRASAVKRAEQAEAEVQRLRVAEAEAMNILEGTELKLEQAEAERDERLTLEESSRLAEKVDKAEFALKEMSEWYRRERDRRVLAEERQRVAEAEVALRDRMLVAEYDSPTPKTAGYMRWFTDLRARADEEATATTR